MRLESTIHWFRWRSVVRYFAIFSIIICSPLFISMVLCLIVLVKRS
nr:MAG TPA: hypothetical protein [Caudoviricetes sp.]